VGSCRPGHAPGAGAGAQHRRLTATASARARRLPWGGLATGLLAAVAAGWNLGFGLPYLFRPDEDVMVGRAVHMAAENSLDPLFYIYPPLVFDLFGAAEALLALVPGQHLGAATSVAPTAEILLARSVSVAAAVITVLLTYSIARRAYGLRAGLLAATALAVAPLAVREAHFATTDAVAAAFVAAAIWAGQRAETRRWFALAGVLAGLAAASKYTGGAALVYVLARALTGADRRASVLASVAACAAAFAVVMAPAGHLRDYWDGLGFLLGRSREFASMPPGWAYHATRSLPFGLGLGAFVLALVGIAAAAWRRRRDDLCLLAFLVAAGLPLALSHEVFFRYVLPLLPALCVLAGGALALVPGRGRQVALAIGLLLLLPSAYNSFRGDWVLGMTDTRQQAAEWLDANAPAGANLGIDSYWGQPFYDAQELGNNPLHPLYRAGNPIADSFQQGLYTTRFVVNRPTPCFILEESGPPWQSSPPIARPTAAAAMFSAGEPSAGAVYDELDSFYLPLWNLDGIDRPGPSIAVIVNCRA
jgi:hypothetical protein